MTESIRIPNIENYLNTEHQLFPVDKVKKPTIIFDMISLAELNLVTMSILLMLNLICVIKYVRKR